MKDLVYISGPPGVGKSTLMAELTRPFDRLGRIAPLGFDLLVNKDGAVVGAEMGSRRAAFSGTDALSMSVGPRAVQWLHDLGKIHGDAALSLVLGEGDRLAHIGFLEGARHAGFAVTLVSMVAPPHVLDGRCAERGSTQNEAWRAGRATKARNFAQKALEDGYQVVPLDASTARPAELAALLLAVVPALGVLARA